ncbi:FtsQ-type POTRA domain-containing protein [Candidatus Berkelbacteria bacterium]|nr:FtsQ-type POTRA domain-containing protein [Candidatus Berkelbacteria bacterium]
MIKNFKRNPRIYLTNTAEKEPVSINWRLVFAFLGLGFFVFLLWFLFYSRFFTITKLEVKGNANEDVWQILETYKGKNIWRFPASRERLRLTKLKPEVKQVLIFRGLPHTLKIEILEREPVLIWKTGDKNYFMDKEGVVFRPVENTEGYPVVFDTKNVPAELSQGYASALFVDFVSRLWTDFEKETGLKADHFEVAETTFQLTLQSKEGFKVFFETIRDFKPQLEGLKNVLAEHRDKVKEYVDLRVEGRAYIK